jgi:ABC-type transporter Mla MlaB component
VGQSPIKLVGVLVSGGSRKLAITVRVGSSPRRCRWKREEGGKLELTIIVSDNVHTLIQKIAAAVVAAMEARMSALDDAIAQLQADVANLTTVDQSAMALITGFATQLAAAVAAAAAAGASPAQLQSLTDLHTAIVAQDDALAGAVASGTPAASPPTP